MGNWFSGDIKDVKARQQKRIAESRGLYDESEQFATKSRNEQLSLLDKGFEQQMSENLTGAIESRDAIRQGEERALERVASVTGNNPLAMLRAKMGFTDDARMKAIYGQFGAQRADMFGAKMASQLGIETAYLQQLSNTRMGKANMLASIQEPVDEGWGKTLAGIGGNILGFKLA